ncbi:MAG TPA: hypothetical protein VFU48_02735 [Nitrospira sp.]|nr:hypothetical protein [Nitrospira sp.]
MGTTSVLKDNKISLGENLIIGISLTVTGLIFELTWALDKVTGILEKQQLKHLPLEREIDPSLHHIRNSFENLLSENQRVFAGYFEREIRNLSDQIGGAASLREIQLETDLELADMMLSPFAGHDDDILRMVHDLKNNSFFFDIHARSFFGSTHNAVRQGRIREVRRIIVFDDIAQLDEELSRRLIAFHNSEKGFACRLIRSDHYEAIKRSMRARQISPENMRPDFGIYGNHFAYYSVGQGPEDLKGRLTSMPGALHEFMNFFEACWKAPTIRPSEMIKHDTTITDLFEGTYATLPNHTLTAEQRLAIEGVQARATRFSATIQRSNGSCLWMTIEGVMINE